MSTQPEFVWSHCNECGQETKHNIVHRADRCRTFSDDLHPVDVGSVWKVLQCRGCEEVALQRVDWCSEDDPQDGPGPFTYFPPRVSRRKPAWMDRLVVPKEYEHLLNEIYVALHADSRRLAAMGARALIDVYITRRVGDQGDFAKGLKKLVEENHIREAQREIVAAAVDAGNASAHRGHCPSVDDISAVIDIVENLIHNELLAEQAQTLRANTPPRPKPGVDRAQPKA
jgi:Domain of unknown function (DUF4145)